MPLLFDCLAYFNSSVSQDFIFATLAVSTRKGWGVGGGSKGRGASLFVVELIWWALSIKLTATSLIGVL